MAIILGCFSLGLLFSKHLFQKILCSKILKVFPLGFLFKGNALVMPSSIFVVGHLGSSRLSHYIELLHYYGVLPYIIDDIVKYFWENIGIDKIPRFVSSGEKYFPLLLTYGNFLTFIYLRDVQLHQFIQKRNYDRRTKKKISFLTLYPFAEVPIKNRK